MDNNEMAEDIFFDAREKITQAIDIRDQHEIINNLLYLLNEYKEWRIK